MPYENEINKIKERLLQIEEEFTQPNADKIKLKNEFDELQKKLTYLKLAEIREILIHEFYESKYALEKAQKNLEEAGIVLEEEEKLNKSKSVSKSTNNTGLITITALAGLAFFLFKK